jgi:hypothetical protein
LPLFSTKLGKIEFKSKIKNFDLNMNSLISELQKTTISPSIDIDSICNKMSKTGIEYDERGELFDFLKLKMAGKSELLKTDERYTRYLRGIDIWEIDGVSYEYLRENIKMFLSIELTESNMMIKLKCMRKIDKQLKEVIDNLD